VDSKKNSAWIAEVINEINRIENIHLAVLVHSRNQSISSGKSVYNIFRKMDQALLPGNPNLLKSVNLNLEKDIPSLMVSPVKKGIKTSYTTEDLREIKKHKSEILLNFSSEILHDEILALYKYGAWCLHVEGVSFSNRSVGFWEWYYKTPLTKVSISQLNIQPIRNVCLASGVTKTEYLSLSRNQTAVFSKGIDLLIGLLAKLTTAEFKIEPISNPLTEGPIRTEPGF